MLVVAESISLTTMPSLKPGFEPAFPFKKGFNKNLLPANHTHTTIYGQLKCSLNVNFFIEKLVLKNCI